MALAPGDGKALPPLCNAPLEAGGRASPCLSPPIWASGLALSSSFIPYSDEAKTYTKLIHLMPECLFLLPGVRYPRPRKRRKGWAACSYLDKRHRWVPALLVVYLPFWEEQGHQGAFTHSAYLHRPPSFSSRSSGAPLSGALVRTVIISKVVIKNNKMKVLPGSLQLRTECSFVNCIVHYITGIENTLVSSSSSFFLLMIFLKADFFSLKRL